MIDSSQNALSFGSVALDYDRGRPAYAVDAVRWILADVPGRRVADVGSGTGKLARQLMAEGADVVAVDPSPAMLDVLRRQVPGVSAKLGRGESLPLGDESVDVVVYSHSFHWVADREAAFSEAARVLTEGGTLVVTWNLRDETCDWVAALSRILGGHNRHDSWPNGDYNARVIGYPGTSFGPFEAANFPHQHVLSRDELMARVRSTVTYATASPDYRRQLLRQSDALIDSHPLLRDATIIRYPHVTATHRAHRLPHGDSPFQDGTA
jgi:SAM-dependent methyltransferase